MKKQTFEQFLEKLCFDINPTVLDDDMPDFFDNWLSEVNVDDIIRWGDLYGQSQYIEGMDSALKQMK